MFVITFSMKKYFSITVLLYYFCNTISYTGIKMLKPVHYPSPNLY